MALTPITEASILLQINTLIVANGGNEITADVLRPILQLMPSYTAQQVGDLLALNTTAKDSTVAAINELQSIIDNPPPVPAPEVLIVPVSANYTPVHGYNKAVHEVNGTPLGAPITINVPFQTIGGTIPPADPRIGDFYDFFQKSALYTPLISVAAGTTVLKKDGETLDFLGINTGIRLIKIAANTWRFVRLTSKAEAPTALGSIVALKAVTGKALGDFMATQGYYAGSVFGGARYKKVDPTGLTANDMDIILATDGSYWQLAETEKVTPYMFGCLESDATHTTKLQRFFTYCDETKLIGDFRGTWDVNAKIVITGNERNKYFCGTLDAKNLPLTFVVSIESGGSLFLGCLHVIGATSASYASKVTENGIDFSNCLSRNIFSYVYAEGFKHWALDMRQNVGKSNIMNNIERLKVINCGAAEGTREYNFNATASVNTGTAGSTAQRSVIDVGALVTPNLKVLEGLIDIAGRKHIVTAVDAGTNKITIYPWIKTGLVYPVNVKSHHGGGLLSGGGDSANLKVGQYDVIGCGQGFRSGGLYGATIQQFQAQGCGVAFGIGLDINKNNLGVSIDKFHEEANDTAILQITSVKTSAVINSVSALRFTKCYTLNAIDALDVAGNGTKIGTSININNTRYEPKDTQLQKNKIGSVSNVILGNNPEINSIVQKRTAPTFELTWDEEVNRLFGYDWFYAKILGSGANNEPTGTITFNLNAADQTAGIRVMGLTSYTITGVLNPLNVIGWFDYANQNWVIKNFTQEIFTSLTLKKLNDYPYLDMVRDDASTNLGDLLGIIRFKANDSQVDVADTLGATIEVIAENDWGMGNVAKAAIVFKTRQTELEAPIERLRIAGDGEVSVNGILLYSTGTTAERPARTKPVGLQYYNTTLGRMEWWNGSAWIAYASTAITLVGYTISTLPAGSIGNLAYVTNGTDAAVNPGTPVGGTGTTVRQVFFNGTAWTY